MTQLRDYQVPGTGFLLRYKRVILGDVVGLGKTVQIVAALREILTKKPRARILIACSQNAVHTWRRECRVWLNSDYQPVIVHGQPSSRLSMWKLNDFVITTLDTYRIDHKKFTPKMLQWDILIIDEPQKRMRSRKTQAFKAFRHVRSEYLFFACGTPVSRGAMDLWTMLYLINPRLFRGYWKFVSTFCYVSDGPFGKIVEGTRNLEGLREVLSTILFRREKRDVGWSEPVRQRIDVDFSNTPKLRRAYTQAANELIAEIETPEGRTHYAIASNLLSRTVLLRSLLLAPQLYGINEVSPGLAVIGDKLEEMDEPHATIFTPFKKCFPVITEYLQKRRHKNFIYLQGGLTPNQLEQAIEEYDRTRGIAICTIKYAQSFDLDSATYAFFHGFEWDPNDHEQAEGRMDRGRTKEMVNIFYPVHLGTIEEEDILVVLNKKQRNTNDILRNPRMLLGT